MAQPKTFQASKRFWTLLITVSTGIALSGCGARSSGRSSSLRNPRMAGGGGLTNQELLSGTGGGQLPAAAVPQDSVSNSLPGSQPPMGNSSQNNFQFAGSNDGLLMLNQTANDFGLLNYCYNAILNRGKELLGSGTPADYVFKGAGQELYRCYNEVLQRRAQELQAYQAYQREQQMRDYWNAYYMAILQSQMRGNYSDIQVALPPSRGTAPKKQGNGK